MSKENRTIAKEDGEHINVLLISSFAPPFGGLTTWSSEYLRAIKGKKISVQCVNTNYIGHKAIRQGNINFLYEIRRSLRIWRDLALNCKTIDADVVHICSPCSFFGNLRDIITLKIAKKKQKHAKMVLHCHCDLCFFVGKGFIKRLVFKILLHSIDVVFVMNTQSLSFIKSHRLSKKVVLIPNFLGEYETKKTELFNDNKIHVLFLGRQTRLKGFDIFLDVARISYQEENQKLVFDVVGDCSEEFNKYDISPNVVLHGSKSHDDAMNYLAQANVLIFPSRTEGFPYAILEAMMNKTAIIAANVGAIYDILGDTGAHIISGWNSMDYYKALQLMLFENSFEKTGKQEFEKYINNYTPKKVIDLICTQYLK